MSLYLMRKEKGLKINDMAARMDIAPSYYSHLENGRRRFTEKMIEKCSLALGEDIDRIKEAIGQITDYSYLMNHWIANIRIYDNNALSLFEKELILNKIESSNELLNKFAKFVSTNIAQSILFEFDKNKKLKEQFLKKYSN